MSESIIDKEFDEVTDQEQHQFTREYKIKTATSIADWLRDDDEGVKLFNELQYYHKKGFKK
jgi:hypothetical protein